MRAVRLAVILGLLLPAWADAQTIAPSPVLEFRFTPTARAQIALWIEKADGTFLSTVGLTQAVALHGIGNRPGASQMNSGFHWPYGRREGVLPIWAHRRAAAPGAAQFKRIIFQDRAFEGDASSTSSDSTPEAYFCLSFAKATTRKDTLDAVTCASGFNSDKGRFITATDVAAGYSEPAQTGAMGYARSLDMVSLYPPRRDLPTCSPNCGTVNTPDTMTYVAHVRQVMSDIDAVTMATLPGDKGEQSMLFTVPNDWLDGTYVAWIEVNTEGDYDSTFGPDTYPTPTLPDGHWDSWAMTYGYPYRGQPSVVYRVPFTLNSAGPYSTAAAYGYGDVSGFGTSGGDVHLMDGTITDNPDDPTTQGSGADRLRLVPPADYRFKISVRGVRMPQGGTGGLGGGAGAGAGGGGGGMGVGGMGVGGMGGTVPGTGGSDPCQVFSSPAVPTSFRAMAVVDLKHSHQWGSLHFVVPSSALALDHYEVRYSSTEISVDDPTSFSQAFAAMAASLETQALTVPVTGSPGTEVDVDFGGLSPLTEYWVGIRAVNICNVAGPYAVATLTTTRINFTKLSGCFVATAAYGSAMQPEVQSLRAVRDALRPRSTLFATATDLYYRSGPAAAALIERSDTARAAVRTLLGPLVQLARVAEAAFPPPGTARARR